MSAQVACSRCTACISVIVWEGHGATRFEYFLRGVLGTDCIYTRSAWLCLIGVASKRMGPGPACDEWCSRPMICKRGARAGAERGRAGRQLRGHARLAQELAGAHVAAHALHRPRHLRALRPAQARERLQV